MNGVLGSPRRYHTECSKSRLDGEGGNFLLREEFRSRDKRDRCRRSKHCSRDTASCSFSRLSICRFRSIQNSQPGGSFLGSLSSSVSVTIAGCTGYRQACVLLIEWRYLPHTYQYQVSRLQILVRMPTEEGIAGFSLNFEGFCVR